jgi:cellulose biosynthesis protein BcsQ
VRVVACYSPKGGVGKTATAVNVGHAAARDGERVLVWDLDPQGASTWYFRVKPKVKGGGTELVEGDRPLQRAIKGTDHDGLDLLPSDPSFRHLDLELDRTRKPRSRLRKLIEPLADEYDVVVLDCPPSVSLVSEAVFRAADVLLVPVVPTTLSVRTLAQLTEFLAGNDRAAPVAPFLSMVDRRRRLHRELSDRVRAERSDLLHTVVPLSAHVERMGEHRAPVADYAPRSGAALAYRDLWREVRLVTESHLR